jgi:hypothetical protein
MSGIKHNLLLLQQGVTPRLSDTERNMLRAAGQVMDLGRRGIRSLAVARTNEEGKWQMMGILTFLDPPRGDTKITIERALEYGVDVKMITGAQLHWCSVPYVHLASNSSSRLMLVEQSQIHQHTCAHLL